MLVQLGNHCSLWFPMCFVFVVVVLIIIHEQMGPNGCGGGQWLDLRLPT
jgi:hypothetical protein